MPVFLFLLSGIEIFFFFFLLVSRSSDRWFYVLTYVVRDTLLSSHLGSTDPSRHTSCLPRVSTGRPTVRRTLLRSSDPLNKSVGFSHQGRWQLCYFDVLNFPLLPFYSCLPVYTWSHSSRVGEIISFLAVGTPTPTSVFPPEHSPRRYSVYLRFGVFRNDDTIV